MKNLDPSMLILVTLLVATLFGARAEGAETRSRDLTCFQEASPYSPELDIGSDMAIVYGVDGSFAKRVSEWQAKGYAIGMMTGIAWGGYGEYFGTGDAFKKDEVQTRKDGSRFQHDPNTGYNVPTKGYTEFFKKYIDPAIDLGVQAIFFEEPEFWVKAGWSPAFKKRWKEHYGDEWQAPDSSVTAQYKASRLKYELYFEMLRDVIAHVKQRAKEKGIEIDCVVPTHSLLNYAQWEIVSPESHLLDIPGMDGVVAQVWTGTARTPNAYRGVMKERTFETAFLEYGSAVGMLRGTGRKVWLLADPVEDNPNHSWTDYKRNYECTVAAKLLWPEAHHYEVMPWPSRIFKGKYPTVDLDTQSAKTEGIPADYATEMLIIINALNEMEQADVEYDTGSRGIGIIVSDTLMFQRDGADRSDPALGHVYGLAMPLVKAGIPLDLVQLENVGRQDYLSGCKVLLLSYDGQKPSSAELHPPLAEWVSQGGCLIYVDKDADPFNAVPAWWNDNGKTNGKPGDDLFKQLGVSSEVCRQAPQPVGKGFVYALAERPADLSRDKDGPEKVLSAVARALSCRGESLKTQNYLRLRRGPFVIAAVLEESISETPLQIKGSYVDFFDPALPIVNERFVSPGTRVLLYDMDWAKKSGIRAKVVAAGARIRDEKLDGKTFSFTARGPLGSQAHARVLLPARPTKVTATPDVITPEVVWDEKSSTLMLSFKNVAQDIRFVMELP